MPAVLGGCSVPSGAGWAPGNEEEHLDHGKAEPGATWHERLTAQ